MSIALENYLRDKLYELESMHEYNVPTDSIRAWIDVYNDLVKSEEYPIFEYIDGTLEEPYHVPLNWDENQDGKI